MLNFELFKIDANSQARLGVIHTAHGAVHTPVFCPVGSLATVKTLTPDELDEIGCEMILANNYHLYLRPKSEVVAELGGLHKFMNWPKPILTDSGGFQVFSLANLRTINDEGVTFKSHIDGSMHFFTPEKAIYMQELLSSDIAMAFDHVPPADADRDLVNKSLERTALWAKRCLASHTKKDQQIFGIVQGGLFSDLRQRAAKEITSLPFDGFAVGGLSLGEPKEKMYSILEETVPFLPKDKVRYLMGVGAPEDIVQGVARGIDVFDCVLPTRVARNGALFTDEGRKNIRRAQYIKMDAPFDSNCNCYTCRNFSAAYLSHLFKSDELLGMRLASIHNISFLWHLIKNIRLAITQDRFTSFAAAFLNRYQTTDENKRLEQKEKWLKANNRDY